MSLEMQKCVDDVAKTASMVLSTEYSHASPSQLTQTGVVHELVGDWLAQCSNAQQILRTQQTTREQLMASIEQHVVHLRNLTQKCREAEGESELANSKCSDTCQCKLHATPVASTEPSYLQLVTSYLKATFSLSYIPPSPSHDQCNVG